MVRKITCTAWKRKHVPTLLNICLTTIAQNMDFWSKDLPSDTESAVKCELKTHFHQLPFVLLDAIMNALNDSKIKYNRENWKLLIMIRHLKSLNFQMVKGISTKEIIYILNLVARRCPDIQELQLPSPLPYSKNIFLKDFLPKFTKLQVLDISRSKHTRNSTLISLGKHCKDLRQLYVNKCEFVTDAGIEGLCVSRFDSTGILIGGICKSIVDLQVLSTGVTEHGIELALNNLPRLEIFYYCSIIQVLAKIHQKCIGQDQRPKYSLKGLYCIRRGMEPYLPFVSGSIERSIQLVQYSSIVSIDTTLPENMTINDFHALKSLNRLKSLKISRYPSDVPVVTFLEGICPVLEAIGGSLESLSLRILNSVNIRDLARFCPNLRSLELYMNNYVKVRGPFFKMDSNSLAMKGLEVLNVVKIPQRCGVTSEDLDILLSSPYLISMYFHGCSKLSDSVLQRAKDLHGFRHLKWLFTDECRNVTQSVVDDMLMNA